MSQLWWGYTDKNGKIYEINLYHGDESGHVLIYVNDVILVIDFSIFGSKQYSFYINEILFSLSITHLNNRFEYLIKSEKLTLKANKMLYDTCFCSKRLQEKMLAALMVFSLLIIALTTWKFLFT